MPNAVVNKPWRRGWGRRSRRGGSGQGGLQRRVVPGLRPHALEVGESGCRVRGSVGGRNVGAVDVEGCQLLRIGRVCRCVRSPPARRLITLVFGARVYGKDVRRKCAPGPHHW